LIKKCSYFSALQQSSPKEMGLAKKMHSQMVILIQVSYLEVLCGAGQYVAINMEYLRLFTAGTTWPCHRIKPVLPRKNSCAVYPRMVVPCAVCVFQQIASHPSVTSRRALPTAYKILYSVHSLHSCVDYSTLL